MKSHTRFLVTLAVSPVACYAVSSQGSLLYGVLNGIHNLGKRPKDKIKMRHFISRIPPCVQTTSAFIGCYMGLQQALNSPY